MYKDRNIKLISLIKVAFYLTLSILWSFSVSAKFQSEIVEVNGQKFHTSEWIAPSTNFAIDKTKAFILLSGPTDNWNSDSAWFASLAPHLAKENRVIVIDRAGLVTSNPSASLGYVNFGFSIEKILRHFKLEKVDIVAFASANLSVLAYLSKKPIQTIQSVTLIDPDVLTPFSIARYSNDAKPFKDNLSQYSSYISAGKYNVRAKQKNAMELKHLQEVVDDKTNVDWQYIDWMFAKRLSITNLKNLFAEIAIYEQDLLKANSYHFDVDFPLTIIDTNFEQKYIERESDEDKKASLIKWRQDAQKYYKKLAESSNANRYIYLDTTEHLVIFSEPAKIAKIITFSN